MLLCVVTSVSAFGLKPTQTRLEFSPLLEHEGQFVVTTNPEEVDAAKIVVEGDLAAYVEIAKDVLLTGEATSIPYTLTLPESLGPGEHLAKIIIEEEVPVEEEGLTAKIRLAYKIIVTVSVPEKHISVKLDVKKGKGILGTKSASGARVQESNDFLSITANVKNVGTLDVSQVTPQVTVTDLSGNDIGTIAMPSKALGIAQTAIFEESLVTGELPNGIYRATASVAYDEEELKITKAFTIGLPLASVSRKDTKFKANEINDFTFDIKSDWNELLQGMTASVTVSKDSERITGVASEPFDLKARDTQSVKTYFDARNIIAGTYDATIVLTYPGGASQEDFEIELFGKDLPGNPWVKIGLIAIIAFNGLIGLYVVTQKVMKKPAAQDPLAAYVQKARTMRYTDAQIKEQLRKSGWKDEEIGKTLR